MADNVTLNSGTGGATLATDDVAGVHFQKVKIDLGGDGSSNAAPVGGGTESGTLRVTIANDSTGVVSVDDNGGSITVDGTVAISGTVSVDSELTTADLDTGAGTDTRAVVGLALAASGGGLLVGAANPMPISDNAGSITVDGSVSLAAAIPAGTNNIGDVDVLSIAAGDNNIGNVDIVTMPNVTIGTMANLIESLADDAAFTPATSRVLPAGFTFDDTTPDSIDEGDIGAARMSANRNQYMTIRDAAGNERGVNVNASNQMSVSVDNTVSVASHAVTNAGTFSVQVTSDTPGTGATNLGKAEDAAHASGDTGVMALTVRANTAAATSGTDGDYQPLITDTNGRLHVLDANSASALTSLQLIDDVVIADDAAFTVGTTKVSVIGFLADETSTDSVDEGDVGAARITLDRKLVVAPQPHSAGGCAIFRSLDLDETEEDVKTSAGCVYGCWVTNTATATRWVKFYNATAATVTVGTTTPVITIGIPGNSADDISGNFGPGGVGIFFDTAICVAATTGVADADTGAPAANDVIVNIFYK